jgi:hypothetical protein
MHSNELEDVEKMGRAMQRSTHASRYAPLLLRKQVRDKKGRRKVGAVGGKTADNIVFFLRFLLFYTLGRVPQQCVPPPSAQPTAACLVRTCRG